MPVEPLERLAIQVDADVVMVRQRVRVSAVDLGMSLVDQTKIVTAASELARNALEHGGGGTVDIERVVKGTRNGLRLTFRDKGPGISDIGLALTDHHSTAGGLGLGLGGAKRLCDEFDIVSRPHEGTTVTVVRWK